MNPIRHFFWHLASDTARSICWLLDNDPDGWSGNEYRIFHEATGVELWIANSAYGLGFCLTKTRRYVEPNMGDPSFADRQVIWRSYKRHGYAGKNCQIVTAISNYAVSQDRFLKKETV